MYVVTGDKLYKNSTVVIEERYGEREREREVLFVASYWIWGYTNGKEFKIEEEITYI